MNHQARKHLAATIGLLIVVAVIAITRSRTASAVPQNAGYTPVAWNFTCVDCLLSGDLRGVSMALDSTGTPHFIYNDVDADRLRYTTADGDGWIVTEVDDVAWNDSTDREPLVVDNNDHLHVAYRQQDTGLRYGRLVTTTWQLETITSTNPSDIKYITLDVDSTGTPHVLFEQYPDEVWYATRSTAVWTFEQLDFIEEAHFLALAVDSNDRPHVAYQYCPQDDREPGTTAAAEPEGFCSGSGQPIVRYSFHDGTQWQTENVDEQFRVGYELALTLDADNRPHIAYMQSTSPSPAFRLLYSYHDGSQWQLEEIGVTTNDYVYGAGTDIEVDAQGAVHVSYLYNSDLITREWLYALRREGSWNVTDPNPPAGAQNASGMTALELDANGAVRVAYLSPGGSDSLDPDELWLASTFELTETTYLPLIRRVQ